MSLATLKPKVAKLIEKVENAKKEQEKSITIVENGTTEVSPDEGKALSKVTINVEVEQSGGEEDTLRALCTHTLKEFTITDEFEIGSKRFYCTSLERFVAPNLKGSFSGYAFYGCRNLKYIDAGNITAFYFQSIGGLHAIVAIIMRNTEQVVSLDSKFNNNHTITQDNYSGGTCYFYVPKALIEDYKVATNWSNYANRFRAIEDYPEITGGVL